jgi:putative phosphoribosyl transferase
MEITIPVRGVDLRGELTIPSDTKGLVLFAHGSGSSRRSPRDQHVARALEARGLATLLFDLLSPAEARQDEVDAQLHFDVDFLAERLIAVTDWVRDQPGLDTLPLAYVGTSTGAAAALVAAARRPEAVSAVVSRGGRPDLAEEWLARVRAPVLFVVGAADQHVLGLNARARARLVVPSQIVVVPEAGHLFEEPGALDEVARLAGDWLLPSLPSTERRALGDPLC